MINKGETDSYVKCKNCDNNYSVSFLECPQCGGIKEPVQTELEKKSSWRFWKK